MKSDQSTIRILMKSDFYPVLTPFLTIIGGGGAVHYWGGGGLSQTLGVRALQKEYKVTFLRMCLT